MSLTKEFLNRPTNITAKVVADSISSNGKRITTFELEYNRFFHAEMMTHGALVKNSSSSRAIPISKMIEQVENNTSVPLYWGKAQSGMQAKTELQGDELYRCDELWRISKDNAVLRASQLSLNKAHKQIANRLLEPFQMIKVVCTATEFDNFFNLRLHPDAQPEFVMLAYKMYQAMKNSTPMKLKQGEWHLPYVERERGDDGVLKYFIYDQDTDSQSETYGYQYYIPITLDEAIKISSSCTAQTSYRKTDNSVEKADKIHDMLIKADVLHASPFAHLATPIEFDLTNHVATNLPFEPETWEQGITHVTRDGVLCSGNLQGWVQYRHLIPNNTCWKFDFEERMKLFEGETL